MWRCAWAGCSRLGWEPTSSSLATTTPSFRWKPGPPSPTSTRPTCSSRSTRTPASDPSARGVETYYLNFTSNPDALEVAARENAVSEKSIFELQDLVKKITLKEKIEESRELATDVQQSLYSGLATRHTTLRDRGVKKAPFVVLIGANMPSILAEISFVSNPTDEAKLETPEYREKIAESLYKGIAKYAGGLSGVKVASKMRKPTGE